MYTYLLININDIIASNRAIVNPQKLYLTIISGYNIVAIIPTNN